MKNATSNLRQIQRKIIRLSRSEQLEANENIHSATIQEPIRETQVPKKRSPKMTIKKQIPSYH